jgi:hypothetical protein
MDYDYRKLFHVLVMGGALVGGVSGCGEASKQDTSPPAQNTGSAGTQDGGTSDAGTSTTPDPDPGGGVQGW